MRPIPEPDRVRRILVRVNNWIGDVVMISPAMRAVRHRFPRAEITLLAKPWVLETLRGSPYCDRLIEYDRDGTHSGLGGRLRLIRQLRRERYDLALLFQKAFEAALFAWAAGVPCRVGFRTDLRGGLLTLPLDLSPDRHHVEQFLEIARAVGADPVDRRLSLHLDQPARDAARRFLGGHGLLESAPRVAFHPGASKPPRAWHPERLGIVADQLSAEFGVRPLLLGGPGDRAALEQVASVVRSDCVLPPENQTLPEMAAVLERCHLLVCNDSGPMHVAAALGVPVVAIFGPGSPVRTAPYTAADRYRVITARFPCSPCRQDFFRECHAAPSGKPYCLEEVRPESVLRACRELLPAGRTLNSSGVGAG